jgi:hypothetical protein
LDATFSAKDGKFTDGWSLGARSTSVESGGPLIHFDILLAKNDSANFIEQFARSHEIAFWKERTAVPIARFGLEGSSLMIQSLNRCRTHLRLHESFDPFASGP